MADQEIEYNITTVSADNIDTREMTTAEINDHKEQKQIIDDENTFHENKKQEKKDLKASAKQKLMNGEALTEDEANVMVGL